MPPTPDSTLRTSSRQAYSANNSFLGGTCGIGQSSGYSSFSQKTSTTGGPIITPISTVTTTNNNNNNWISSSNSSVQNGFEPIIKQTESYSNSNQILRGSNREEEEEEVVTSGNDFLDSEKQFRPISSFQPIIEQNLTETKKSNSKNKNFSSSSYEYQNNNQQKTGQEWPISSTRN
jgi:hypothetical protein